MQPLSALPVPEFSHITLVRPLLPFAREELREFLAGEKGWWTEDIMNADPRFARARIRAAWPELVALGLTPQRLADAAWHLGRARVALDALTEDFLRRGARLAGNTAALDPLRLKMLPRELGLRVLAKLLSLVSGEEYRPRFDSLERLFDAILGGGLGGGATLHGCIVAPAPVRDQIFGSATIVISREEGRKLKEPVPPPARTRVTARRGNQRR
jgi:tRNA(Ile)-lysidine synthase